MLYGTEIDEIFQSFCTRLYKINCCSNFSLHSTLASEITERDCDSLETGRKLKVHKTFRRRPERLLNVLGTLIYVLYPWDVCHTHTSLQGFILKNELIS